MGLFSNLFGNDGKDIDNALNKMKNLTEDIMDDGQINSAQGIPYIRFYYDHEGWWNTKSYVIRRTSEALGI